MWTHVLAAWNILVSLAWSLIAIIQLSHRSTQASLILSLTASKSVQLVFLQGKPPKKSFMWNFRVRSVLRSHQSNISDKIIFQQNPSCTNWQQSHSQPSRCRLARSSCCHCTPLWLPPLQTSTTARGGWRRKVSSGRASAGRSGWKLSETENHKRNKDMEKEWKQKRCHCLANNINTNEENYKIL